MQQRSEITRKRIMEAATRLFANAGYNATSVDQICKEAGVSKGAFYHHFSSKQAIFVALFEDWIVALDDGMKEMHKENIPQTLLYLTNMIPLIFETADEHLPIVLEYWLLAGHDEVIRAAILAPYRHYQDLFAKLIEEGMAEGTLKTINPQAAAQVIVSLAVGLLIQGILDPKGADWQKVASESIQILMNGLGKEDIGLSL
ncbi:MAG: TetR/AcrR family transcriptional regulator [Anaerolineales bacterium]|nr:TetR/AcrR family transcriptional regulator [Anaerolineales bacterium]